MPSYSPSRLVRSADESPMGFLRHISFYTLSVSCLCLLVSYAQRGMKAACARVASAILFAFIITIVVVPVAVECEKGAVIWSVWVVKIGIFIALCLRFSKELRLDFFNFACSVFVTSLYCGLLNVRDIYSCDVRASSIFLSVAISTVLYACLRCLLLCNAI